MNIFKSLWKLIFGNKIREYVNSYSGRFLYGDHEISISGNYVVYKCYNSKTPETFWYETDVNQNTYKIQGDLYTKKGIIKKA